MASSSSSAGEASSSAATSRELVPASHHREVEVNGVLFHSPEEMIDFIKSLPAKAERSNAIRIA